MFIELIRALPEAAKHPLAFVAYIALLVFLGYQFYVIKNKYSDLKEFRDKDKLEALRELRSDQTRLSVLTKEKSYLISVYRLIFYGFLAGLVVVVVLVSIAFFLA